MDFINSLWETYKDSAVVVMNFILFFIFFDFVIFKWKRVNPDKSYKGRFIGFCIVLLILHWIGWV